jgi:hypothetical protein
VPERRSPPEMAFRKEIEDVIAHAVGLRKLIELSRPSLAVAKPLDEEQTKKREQEIQSIKEKLGGDLSSERINGVILLARKSTPSEIDEMKQKLERMEFLLEDIRRGRDKKNDLQDLIDSFRRPSIEVYNALAAIETLRTLRERDFR